MIFCLELNIRVIYKLIVLLWWVWSSMLKVPKITSLQYLCNISRNMWGANMIFLHEGKHQSFLKASTVVFTDHSQPNIPKIACLSYLCNIWEKKGGIKLIALYADKHQTILRLDSINLGGHVQRCLSFPKQQVYKIFEVSQETTFSKVRAIHLTDWSRFLFSQIFFFFFFERFNLMCLPIHQFRTLPFWQTQKNN